MWLNEVEMLIPGLYQGAVPYRQQRDFYDPYDIVVFCTDPDQEWLVSYQPLDSQKTILHFHLDDIETDMPGVIEKAKLVADRVKAGEKAAVLCASGMYRSGSFAVLVLWQYGYDIDRAASRVLAGRSCLLPAQVQNFVNRVKQALADQET
jgi:hypothetical protein